MNFQGFEVGELVHEGRSADVFRARRESDERCVLLKIFKPAYPSPERLDRIRHEFDIASLFDTPFVVKVLAMAVDQHRHALVIEDFEATALSLHGGKNKLTLPNAIRLAIAIVEALSALHSFGVVHKDLNPSNILWNDASGRLALADFGTASRIFSKMTQVTREDLPEGSLGYISPEQTGRTNRGIDYRTDLYSLGITLYELFTGVLPFPTNDPAELMHAHIAIQATAPHERRADIPIALSDIIMKLMAKGAEDRYQSTIGVLADLRICLADLESGNVARRFSLGTQDTFERLELPRRLYGRERDKRAISLALEQMRENDATRGVHVILVSGSSGIGKSALIQQLQEPFAQLGGFFVAGKFDQLQRTGPFAAPIAALRDLARQLLSEPPARLGAFRERLVTALGPNGRVLVDVIPEMELVIGSQPPVPELGPIETQNRFHLVFRNFVRIMATRAAPLCIFLDDLQWADSATLKWLDLLLEDDELEQLLIVGAYRDQEVGPGHPFTLTRNRFREGAGEIHELHLEPLGIQEVSAMVADFVGSDPTNVRPLADLVLRKTEGNPLFAGELLKTIYDDGLIALDRAQGRWVWDIAAIEQRGITNNIVDIVIGKMRRLPEQTQRILQIAACIGNSFDLETLSIIEETTRTNVTDYLEPAVAEGFVLVRSHSSARSVATIEANSSGHYNFVHDRIQQAAYALIDAHQRKAVHLRIGRLLFANMSDEGRAERIFDLVDQMNSGRDLLAEENERIDLVRLNLDAGKRAMAAAAHGAAGAYLAIAAEILGENAFDRHYDLAIAVHRALATAESLIGEGMRAEKRLELVLEKSKTAVEQAEACNMLISQLTLVARYREAIDVARDGLARVGIDLARDNIFAAFEAELAASQETLGDRPIASLYDSPPIADPKMGVAVQIFENIMSAALYTDPVLWFLCVVKGTHLCFRFGAPVESPALIAYYGHVLHMTRAKTQLAYEFGELAMRLADRFNSAYARCLCGFVLGNFILPWVRPLKNALPINRVAYQAGIDGGESRFSGYSLIYRLMNQYLEGKPLAEPLADLPGFLAINQRSKNQVAIDIILGIRLLLQTLSSASPTTHVGYDAEAEGSLLATYRENGSLMPICYHHIFKTQLLYLLDAPGEALQSADVAFEIMPAIAGNVAEATCTLFAALSLAAIHNEKSGDDQNNNWARLVGYEQRLTHWASLCPEMFGYMRALVAGEIARISKNYGIAADFYEQARQLTRDARLIQYEALANELAAKLWLHLGRERLARALMAEAVTAYEVWGAHRKVMRLSIQYRGFVTRG
ncbi:MAG TPA: serine/threonine-protein kinase PknK, partial [Polyangium sp.]|nr:serine/threonine-protein kinase PknK [Polyangium sp.]